LAKVCKSVLAYEEFFTQALQSRDPTKTDIPQDVKNCIDREQFYQTSQLLVIIGPIADLFSDTEGVATTLADIYIGVLNLFNSLSANVTGTKPLKKQAINIINKLFKKYIDHDIYVSSIYVWPKYRILLVLKSLAMIFSSRR
jgi:hypothetical protein